ncbi:hypothetical protein BVRB_3g049060 [Beta vulgaris subsp. vulgaris]|nr:hypothetical protein BVRB_3g049060 [Beta vulgaris subsp. vulgaris]
MMLKLGCLGELELGGPLKCIPSCFCILSVDNMNSNRIMDY